MNRRQFLTSSAAALAAPAVISAPAFAAGADIVDLAVATPDLSTLVTAVQAAGLVDTLKGKGPFTVFAPTNRAFAHLPHGVLDNLLKPENVAQLQSVLTYHVSPGAYFSSVLAGRLGRLPTAQGGFILSDARHGGVRLNRTIHVTTADIRASNGVVHIIDGVLLPH